MAKHRYAMDDPKIERYLKEGRGKGTLDDYKPFLTIQDVPSTGRVTRCWGRHAKRLHHLLSDIETAIFLLMDWEDKVIDLREQFPLDRALTRRIASEMSIQHPQDRKTKVDIVVTIDLLVDAMISGRRETIAVSSKPATELDDTRTVEKLELERRAAAEQLGATWLLFTDRHVPATKVLTLRWMAEMYSLDGLKAPYPGYWTDRSDRLLSLLGSHRAATIKQLIDGAENSGHFATGDVLTLIRHLAAHKRIGMNFTEKFTVDWPVAWIAPAASATLTRIK